MKNYLICYLFITLSIIVNSCTEGFKEEYSKLFIALTEVTAITTPTTDTTPDYTFSSTESGALTYGGSCSSSTTHCNHWQQYHHFKYFKCWNICGLYYYRF